MSTVDDLAALQVPDAIEAATQLAALLDLPSIGLQIRGARIVGRGSKASADLRLSDDTTISFESLRDVGNATRLALEVAACTGATPKLKAPQALQAIRLLRMIADHEETFTSDDIAREWGTVYLDGTAVEDIDFDDQRARWRAFSNMRGLDPAGARRAGTTASIAAGSVVLRTPDGTRFVRAGWFAEHVREGENVSPADIAHRMERVGWQRRGKTGRVKATSPTDGRQIGWNFHIVPAGWEDR